MARVCICKRILIQNFPNSRCRTSHAGFYSPWPSPRSPASPQAFNIAGFCSPWPSLPASPPASRSHGADVDTSPLACHSQGDVTDALRPDVLGENNHPAFSAEALGCPLLAMFDKIVRDLKGDSLSVLIYILLEDARTSSDVEMVKDLFMMAFQTRWCRGGKAEKLLFF
jgi:hypothetical protein